MEGFAAFAAALSARPDEFFAPNEQLAERIKTQLKFIVDNGACGRSGT